MGPKWSKVVRRVTYDMHSGKVLDDVNPKGMTIDDLTAPIRNVKTNGRDIVTEFHFLRGSWQPSSRNVDDKPVRQDLTKPYAAPGSGIAVTPACVEEHNNITTITRMEAHTMV